MLMMTFSCGAGGKGNMEWIFARGVGRTGRLCVASVTDPLGIMLLPGVGESRRSGPGGNREDQSLRPFVHVCVFLGVSSCPCFVA